MYKTQVELSVATGDPNKADIRLEFAPFSKPGAFGQASIDGTIQLDNSDKTKFAPSMGAHEFSHAFLGIRDAYGPIRMPDGRFTGNGYPFGGWENDIMGSHSGGVTANNLQTLTVHFMNLAAGQKPGK